MSKPDYADSLISFLFISLFFYALCTGFGGIIVLVITNFTNESNTNEIMNYYNEFSLIIGTVLLLIVLYKDFKN